MLLLLSLLGLALATSVEPALNAPDAALEPGAAATLSLTPDDGTVFVDGCAAVELERLEGGRWVPVGGAAPCEGTAPAKAVSTGLAFTLAPPGPGEYRGVAAWGTGCVQGRPFALAACTRLGVARSGTFTVNAAPAAVQR
jgi:hypothetical protein